MIVVTGATGNVGQAVVRELVEAGEQVRAVSRHAARTPWPAGVSEVLADLAEPESLRSALAGADALFLMVAGQAPAAVLALAEASGARRVVLLSSQGAGTRPQDYPHPRSFEDAVRASGLDWTILRPSGFFTNYFGWIEPVRAHRTAAAPYPDVAIPFVDPADIASVAATVLRGTEHAGQVYELTGPAPTTPRERATAIADALGSPLRFVEQTHDEARAQLVTVMPAPVADATLAILGAPVAAETRVSPDVARVLGRAPHTFADWAARNIAAFR